MGKRKLMTINDLYNFCLKNNFYHFNSSDNNEEIYVQLPATFESKKNDDKDKEGLTPFVAKAYHDHINLNKSEIKPETLEATLPSAMLRPILASIVVDEKTGEKDFGSHDFSIEEDENGNEIIHYIEQPVGVIYGNNTIEYDEEDGVNRAILYGYLFDGYCQDAVDVMNRRKTVDCSVELSIREMSFNTADKVLTLDDFYVSGLTLLGSSVKPGMKGSQVTIEDFCEKKNSMFSHNEKLIEMLEQLNTKIDSLSNFTIKEENSEKLEEGRKETVTKFEELLVKYNKTVEDITFEYENLSDEELEAKFEEMFTEDNSDGEGEADPEPISNDNEENNSNEDEVVEDDNTDTENTEENNTEANKEVGTEQFSEKLVRTYEISHDDIRYGLYNLLLAQESVDNEWYFINAVYDNHFTYENWTGDKIYGQSYTKDGDNVAFDGERWNLHRELLTDSEYVELQSMRSNYSSISEELSKYQNAEIKAQKEEILSDKAYVEFAETEEFKTIVKEADSLTVEELRTKCELAFAKLVKETKVFCIKNEESNKKVNKIGINADFSKYDDNEPYGDYFRSLERY